MPGRRLLTILQRWFMMTGTRASHSTVKYQRSGIPCNTRPAGSLEYRVKKWIRIFTPKISIYYLTNDPVFQRAILPL